MNLSMQAKIDSVQRGDAKCHRPLMAYLHVSFSRWRISRAAMKNFLRDCDASPYGRGVPRRIWRRHGALLASTIRRD